MSADSKTMKAVPVRRRSASRMAAIQIIYQSLLTGKTTAAFVPDFLAHYAADLLSSFKIKDLDQVHLNALFSGVELEAEALDRAIANALRDDWTVDRLSRIELALLRCGVFELQNMPHIPARAVVSEYAALADSCGAEVGFVNAVLDHISHMVRQVELG